MTVEEPETEDAGEGGAPSAPPMAMDTSEIRVMEQSRTDMGPDYADSSESFLATHLRAYASHFWSSQENKYGRMDRVPRDMMRCFVSLQVVSKTKLQRHGRRSRGITVRRSRRRSMESF